MRIVPNFEIEIGHHGRGNGVIEWIGVCPIIERYDPDFGEMRRQYMEEYDALDSGDVIPNYPIPADWHDAWGMYVFPDHTENDDE